MSGGTPSKSDPANWVGSIPWASPKDLKRPRLFDTLDHISRSGLQSGSALAPAGSVFVVVRGMILAKDIPVAQAAVPMAFNQDLKAIIPGARVLREYLPLAIAANKAHLRERLGRSAHGTRSLLSEDIATLEIPLPTEDEQRRIATILWKVQRAVEVQERLVATVRELKQAAMGELFTRGLRGEAQKETEIGVVPESWEVVRCSDIAREITVGVVVKPASHYVSRGVPAFRSLNVREDRLETEKLVYFSQEANDSVLAKSKLRAGDVLVVRTGYPGTSCVVPPEYDGANCIDLVIARPDHGRVSSDFISRFLNSAQGRMQSLRSSYGLAQQHLNVGAVRDVRIPLPALAEQHEVATALQTIDRKLAHHERKRDTLQELFKTLLHDLMSGRIRVHELDLDITAPTAGTTGGEEA